MKRTIVRCVVLVVVLLGLAANAPAQATIDNFFAVIGQDGTVTGGGTGYDGGHWFFYDNTGWWNQWFYDHPLDLTRQKSIDYSMQAVAEPLGTPGNLTVAINWSSDLYPYDEEPPYVPPLPPLSPEDEAKYIVRQVVFDGPVPATDPVVIFGHIDITDYNPEWVSIDIQGGRVRIDNGIIRHECLPVPEPGTLTLLALGGLALARRRPVPLVTR